MSCRRSFRNSPRPARPRTRRRRTSAAGPAEWCAFSASLTGHQAELPSAGSHGPDLREQQNEFDTHFADLYKAISNTILNFISFVYRADLQCHENSQQEMNFAFEIVDIGGSRRTAKNAAATLAWIVFGRQRAHLRERLRTPDQDGPFLSGLFGGALWIARRESQLKSGPREAV